MGALASAGAGDSAASALPGEGVAGSSRPQESLVLADPDPDPVTSSSSPGGDRRSRSRWRGNSTRDRSRLSPPRVRAFREEHCCARSWSWGSRALSWESRSRSMDHSRSRGRKCSRHDSSRSPSARVRSRCSRLRSTDRYRDCRMHSRSRSDSLRSRRLRSRLTGRDTDPTTGHVTARGLGRGVGGLDGVTGTARRLLLLSAIAATLG